VVVNLDHAATTALEPLVRARLVELLELDANPSAAHELGRRAKAILERSRAQAAAALGVSPREVVFVGSATEGLALAVGGLVRGPDSLVVTTPLEHEAVRAALGEGNVEVLDLDALGRVDLGAARALLRRLGGRLGALVVSAASSETGVIQPVAQLARLVRHQNPAAVVVSDLVALAPLGLDPASPARQALAAADIGVVAPHKLGGPTGVAVVAVREHVRLAPLVRGGGQERGLRGGTQAVWLAGAGALALALANQHGAKRRERILERREAFERLLRASLPEARIAGAEAPRVGISLVALPPWRSEELVVLLDLQGVCVSAGAACSAGAPEASAALLAMGWDPELARSVVRVSVAPSTSDEDIERAVAAFVDVVAGLQRAS